MPQPTITKYRVRFNPNPVKLAKEVHLYQNAGLPDENYGAPQDEASKSGTYERLVSVNHPGFRKKKRKTADGFLINDGGPFEVRRFKFSRQFTDVSFINTEVYGENNQDRRTHSLRGGVINSYDTIPLVPTESDLRARFDSMSIPAADLSSWGATGYAKYSPLKSEASAGQFLAELREGLPRIPFELHRRLLNFKASHKRPGARTGSEYLNYQFGWVPLLSDLRAMYALWHSINSKMAQIIKDNGKPIRRGGTLYKNTDTTYNVLSEGGQDFSYPQLTVYNFTGTHAQNKVVETVVSKERIWFKGRFRYYIPDVTSDEWTRKAKLSLFGLDPSPALLYQVMPWSWLIDWFSNVGDVISNLSSNGIADLITDYAFVMRHFERVTTTTAFYGDATEENFPNGSIRRGNSVSNVITEETKERIAATPFGFGLQVHDLSVRQLAILGALGLSRSNF